MTSTRVRAPIDRALKPLRDFAEQEASSGILLLACAAAALWWANSPYQAAYHHLLELPIGVGVPGGAMLTLSLEEWIADGLMAVFFLFVGLEIKRELLVGQLASPRRAALPAAAAIGGMVVPALLFLQFAGEGDGRRGWGIPMATDIAFALGAMALLGRRAPAQLRVFLAALAIVDDLGAVLVIALFYSSELQTSALVTAGAIVALLALANRVGVRSVVAYAVGGVFLWIAVHASGIHATVAGVLLAFTMPARTRIDPGEFLTDARAAIDAFEGGCEAGGNMLTNETQQVAVERLEQACREVHAPALAVEHRLARPVAFLIMPLFALASAGVTVSGDLGALLREPVTLGVSLGLLLGKPIGITVFAWLAVRLGIAALPAGARWLDVAAVGLLGGIGFTMSLFVTRLAFAAPVLQTEAKVGILGGSLVAGLAGMGAMLLLHRRREAAAVPA